MIEISNIQAETSVLSMLLSFQAAFDEVGDRIQPHHFTVPLHRRMYSEIVKQAIAGKGFDVVSIAQGIDAIDSLAQINEIAVSSDHSMRALSRHVSALIESYKSRELHALSVKMAELAMDTKTPAQDRIDRAAAELAKLDDVQEADDWIDAHQAAIQHLSLIEDRENGVCRALETGLCDFDEALDGGLARGALIVLGARPGMGKTALAMTIGLQMARNYSVGLLSMEMPHADLRDRQTAFLARAPLSHIKRPKKGLEYERIVDGVEQSKRLKFFASDKSGLNILQVRSKARTLKRRHGLDVLIVDYIGLMAGLDSKQPRAYQIEEISRGLKALAKELDIAVICLAQVNRGTIDRAGQIPTLSDLRDSGAIEQDADVVGFIHRPIQADPNAGRDFENYALLRVAKNRQGRPGDIHLSYLGAYTAFSGWEGPPPTKSAGGKGGSL
jgi:replicative DNA helicase